MDRHLPTDADCEILRANPVSFANRTKQKNTETFLQEALIKLRSFRVILSLKALHSLRMVKLQDLLTADTTNGRMGQVFCSCHHPCVGSQVFRNVTRILSSFQVGYPCPWPSSFGCHERYLCLRRRSMIKEMFCFWNSETEEWGPPNRTWRNFLAVGTAKYGTNISHFLNVNSLTMISTEQRNDSHSNNATMHTEQQNA